MVVVCQCRYVISIMQFLLSGSVGFDADPDTAPDLAVFLNADPDPNLGPGQT